MQDKVFFDTNVLVYAHDSSEPEKRSKSQELIFRHIRDGSFVVSSQVLSEFFVTVTRKISVPISVPNAKKEILLLSTTATVDMDATLVVRAIEIQERWHLSYWDSLILSSAERAECKFVYSEDISDGTTYGGVSVANPFFNLPRIKS
jgi:predicted nucleic acid-binding protein